MHLVMQKRTTLIVNIYKPCDAQCYDDISREFESILGEMSIKYQEENVNIIILGGDFDTDFSRSSSQILHKE